MFISRALATDYKIDEFHKMVESSDNYRHTIATDFYNYNDSTKNQKLATITHDGLTQLKRYRDLADSLAAVPLPKQLKKQAIFRSKIIKLQCRYYNFLYLELRDSTKKYRPAITAATDSINKLRMEMGSQDR